MSLIQNENGSARRGVRHTEEYQLDNGEFVRLKDTTVQRTSITPDAFSVFKNSVNSLVNAAPVWDRNLYQAHLSNRLRQQCNGELNNLLLFSNVRNIGRSRPDGLPAILFGGLSTGVFCAHGRQLLLFFQGRLIRKYLEISDEPIPVERCAGFHGRVSLCSDDRAN
jgi:hypothetical protein